MHQPSFYRYSRIKGYKLDFYNVVPKHYEFIYDMRTNHSRSSNLSSVASAHHQLQYIIDYTNSTDSAYYVISFDGELIGTVRLYDANNFSFSWGFWMLVDAAPSFAAIESALIVYTYALNELGFRESHFKVNRSNRNVCRFHERFGSVLASTTDTENFYNISQESIQRSLNRYSKFLPKPLLLLG